MGRAFFDSVNKPYTYMQILYNKTEIATSKAKENTPMKGNGSNNAKVKEKQNLQKKRLERDNLLLGFQKL